MVTSTRRCPSFIIDSRASRNMVSTMDSFSSLDDSNGPNISLGYNSNTKIKGKGRIDIDHGSFNNVLYVLGLVTNIFSIY